MLFKPDRLYDLEEIESLANFKPTQWSQGYSVIDMRGDHGKYDFVGDRYGLQLWAVDGKRLVAGGEIVAK